MSRIKFPKFRNWKLLTSILVPLLLLPIIFLGKTETDAKRFKCGYTILVMGIFWMLEIFPLAVTALIPVVLFPLFGIQNTAQVVANYMKETQMMFIGGISLALALQYSELHKRIALRIMILIGSSPWKLLLGILVTSTLLSCVVVVNTAVAAMMIPIVSGLVDGLADTVGENRKKKLRIVFMLAVGYGANIGGTATLIGSQPNLIYKELIQTENLGQNGKYLDLNFFTFCAYSMPIAILNLFLTWLILGSLHLNRPGRHQRNRETENRFSSLRMRSPKQNNWQSASSAQDNMDATLRNKYIELGRMGFNEIVVLFLLALAISLWLTRNPQVFPGWFNLFPKHSLKIGDSSVGIAILLLMFIIPRKLEYFQRDFDGAAGTILSWQYIQEHFPWNVLFIVGGGLAISDGANASGLSRWIGEGLENLENLPNPVILLVLLIIISIFTEVMSNAATVSLLTPILIALSKRLQLHPLYLSLPGAVACQYAFVLPTSNPPNAIVFSAGGMKISDMAKAGILLNSACVCVLYLMNLTWGEYIFRYSDYEYLNTTTT